MLQLYGSLLFRRFVPLQINFKLKKLEIHYLEGQCEVQENLNAFLRTQKDSLESVAFIEMISDETMQIVSSMPRLKEAVFGGMFHCYPQGDSYEYTAVQQNDSITSLDLSKNPHIPTLFLQAFSKLETLKILYMDDYIANLISERCKSLIHLSVEIFYARYLYNEEFYTKLIEFTCQHPPSDRRSKRLFQRLNGRLK